MSVRWLSPHPHGRDFFLDGIAAAQKDQSFILRVRKYELRVAEPFILCRTLVPIMTATYYISSPSAGNRNFIVFFHNSLSSRRLQSPSPSPCHFRIHFRIIVYMCFLYVVLCLVRSIDSSLIISTFFDSICINSTIFDKLFQL